MNKLLTGTIVVSGLLMWQSCSDTFDPSSDREGRILPVVEVNRAIAGPAAGAKAKSRATGQAMEISADDLRLRLTADNGTFSQEWHNVAAFDNGADFPVGTYLFEAIYGTEGEEGFDKPYYYGSTSLRVLENQTTPANVTATLANAMVTIQFTDNVRDYFTAITGQVVTAGGTYEYTTAETRTLYVNPGKVDINAEVVKQSGAKGTLSVLKAPFDAEARNHYIVTVDVDGGTGMLDITFDAELVEEEHTIDISDDVLNAPAPVLTTAGFTSGETLTVVEGSPAPGNLRVTALAHGMLKMGVLTTRSVSLLAQGWPETVDFATADAATLQKLTALGLEYPGFTGVMSKMGVLDFTKVIEHIAFEDGYDNTTEFSFVVKDAYSKVSEPVVLNVAVEKLSLEVLNVEPLAMGEQELMFNIEYNGANPSENISFQLKNARGMWDAATPVSVTPLNRAGMTYRVVLNVPGDDSAVTFRAVCAGIVTPEQTVERKGAPIAVDAVDVYARRAALTVLGDNAGAFAQEAKVYLSTNGSDFSEITPDAVNGASVAFGQLEPATKYYVRIFANEGYSRAVEFTTEAATQLPYSGMDEWTYVKKGDYQYEWSVADGSAWGTLNALTVSSFGSGSGNGLNTGGCSYKATSGTIPANGRSTQSSAGGGAIGTTKHYDGHTDGNATLHSDRQHSGANAALVRTVGWGGGNTAKASGSGFGTCQNTTAGELYLGTYSNAPVYGRSFGSRPSAMKFYYKYATVTEGNGDFGSAEVSVTDNAGNVIASGTMVLAEQSAYTEVTLPLDYTVKAKAAKISVVFKSSANPVALDKDTRFWNCPGAKNTSGGEYVGSELYIDDIELIY